jgi:prevent-host-death family protein
MNTTEARKEFSDALNRVAYKGERIEIRRRGKPVAAIVPFDDLKLIEELEDKILLAKMKKSEKDRGGITLAQLKNKLGI